MADSRPAPQPPRSRTLTGRWRERFACAGRGLGRVVKREPSARVHAAAAALTAGCGVWLDVSAAEWAILALACGAVFGAEALNTAIERLADRVSTDREDALRDIKDMAAGGVLAVTFGAVAAGIAVFGPKLWTLIFG